MVATATTNLASLHDTSEQGSLFSRSQVVSRILELNPTTTVTFLASFSDETLGHYLARLNVVQQPRPSWKGWVRVGGTPAILSREADD